MKFFNFIGGFGRLAGLEGLRFTCNAAFILERAYERCIVGRVIASFKS